MRYLLLLLVLMLGGCSSGIINIPSTEVIDSTGKIITKTAGTIGNASTYRTHEKYQAWDVANVEYTKQTKASGFQMDFAMVDVNGQMMYLPKKISFREAPQFHAPADLHDHPVWHTIDKAVGVIAPWGFGTWAATSIVSSMEHVASKPTNQYNGPVQNTGSYNQAGRDQTITANGPKQDQGHRDNSPGCSNGNCGGEKDDLTGCDEKWVTTNVPGCSSCNSFLAGRCSVKPGDPGVPF